MLELCFIWGVCEIFISITAQIILAWHLTEKIIYYYTEILHYYIKKTVGIVSRANTVFLLHTFCRTGPLLQNYCMTFWGNVMKLQLHDSAEHSAPLNSNKCSSALCPLWRWAAGTLTGRQSLAKSWQQNKQTTAQHFLLQQSDKQGRSYRIKFPQNKKKSKFN